ncbi:HD-GYP domain-containing protein [Halodesulfovibrio marinisediminis]|uniref:HD domain-containing protein n=1 Tax=Halodesulfovibrio marinisediminis DSM 17456 TaxID=1121457 RepID=A0A1N6GTG6_9BACT|nr:HD domain-containing phosphohydrolase [Halodesulfovibrio marinisediminis]SIO10625.1 HD domain-containing protein [Halodesulfovibrio marinisediminis DSM 17456]
MVSKLSHTALICLITYTILSISAHSAPDSALEPAYWPISGWFLACFIRFGIGIFPFLLGTVLVALSLSTPYLTFSGALVELFYYYIASVVIKTKSDSSISSKHIIFYTLIAISTGIGASAIPVFFQNIIFDFSNTSVFSVQNSILKLASITSVTPVALLLLYRNKIVFDKIRIQHILILALEILILVLQATLINTDVTNINYTTPLLIPITLWACLTLSFSLACWLVFFSTLITSIGLFFFQASYALSLDYILFIQLQTCIRSFSIIAFAALRYERDLESTKLRLVQNATLISLANLAETRDNETGSHIKRTQKYVSLLTSYLSVHTELKDQLPPKAVERICRSAPLHDIGKVGIPDSILLKPGPLTSGEFNKMKEHTIIGQKALEEAQEMLGQESFLETAQTMALTHHEKWDGTGYPQGLRGQDIPIEGRIMALADVYDALTSPRVYKAALSHSEASEIIISERNKQFDPLVVDAFEALAPEFSRIQTMDTKSLNMPKPTKISFSRPQKDSLLLMME